MGTTDGNGVYTPDLDEEGWDPELATNFDLFSQAITDHAAHLSDTSAAHAASAVSFSPTGTVAATDVQAAIAEVASEAAAGAGAPTNADYLVGTANGSLSAEIVVGTSPGGELGGTWASPTVDSSHAGGTHAASQAAAEATAASALTTHAGAADPHTGYQKESEKAAASGYASLDGSTKVPIAQVPTGTSSSTVALGDAAAALDATHAAAADPHTGYQRESEKAAASGYASLDGSTKVPLAQLPTGTSSSTVALGDAAAGILATHEADTTSIHGITDTAALETTTGSAAKVTTHEAAADPHTGYQRESEKAAASGYASLDGSTKVPIAQLPDLFTQQSFSKQGPVAITTGTLRWYNLTGRTLTFHAIAASVGTAPTGAALIVDVNKDGTTIFTTQGSRPQIAISGFTDLSDTPDVTTIANGSYLTVDIDQVGSTIAGSDLTVQVVMKG